MNSSWTVTIQPAAEPIILPDAKTHVGLTTDETQWDGYLPGLILAARKMTERRTGRAMITQTLTMYLDRFPAQTIYLPVAPAASISSVKYYDAGGTLTTLSAASYQFDKTMTPARIIPAYGYSWPTTRTMLNAVEVLFVAGYGAAGSAVDGDLIHAMKLLIGHWFANREAVGDVGPEIAFSYNAIVENLRVRRMEME